MLKTYAFKYPYLDPPTILRAIRAPLKGHWGDPGIGTPLRPKNILDGYMEPEGL